MDHFHNNEKIKECMIATLSLLYESATYRIFVLQMTKFKLKKNYVIEASQMTFEITLSSKRS